MDTIFVSVTGTTKPNVVVHCLKSAGYKVGDFEAQEFFFDDSPEGMVGELEVDESILSGLMLNGFWEVDLAHGMNVYAEWI